MDLGGAFRFLTPFNKMLSRGAGNSFGRAYPTPVPPAPMPGRTPGLNPTWSMLPPRDSDFIPAPGGGTMQRMVARYGQDPASSAWERQLYPNPFGR